MINVRGHAQRAFHFPADPPAALDFYSDIPRLISWLPHISLISQHAPDSFRVAYQTTELAAYHIEILCDLQVTIDQQAGWLHIDPAPGIPTTDPHTSFNRSVGHGYFSSRSHFQPLKDEAGCQIEYTLALQADLATPRGLGLMPGGVVNRIARAVTYQRIDEIVGGFIRASLDAFGA